MWKLKGLDGHEFSLTTLCIFVYTGSDLAPGFPPCSFHRVLLDAPCSGIGNRPRVTLSFPAASEEKEIACLEAFPDIQKKLIKNAVTLLKPGPVTLIDYSLLFSSLVIFLSSYTPTPLFSLGAITLIDSSLLFSSFVTSSYLLYTYPTLVARCNHYHWLFHLFSSLETSYLSYLTSYTTLPHWRLVFSCHQVQSLSLSLLISSHRFSSTQVALWCIPRVPSTRMRTSRLCPLRWIWCRSCSSWKLGRR